MRRLFTALSLHKKADDRFPAGFELAYVLLVNNSNVSGVNKNNGIRKENLQCVRRMAQVPSSLKGKVHTSYVSVKFNQKSRLKDCLKLSETCK